MITPSFTSVPNRSRASLCCAWRRVSPVRRLRQALVVTLIAALILTALPLSKRLIPPAQAMQGIRPCTNAAYQIIQGCKLGGNGESELETLVINDLLQLHNLPASDRARLLGWERGRIRSNLFDKIIGYIKKSPYNGLPVSDSERTEDEQAIVTGLTNRVKERRILAATKAIDEFNRWQVTCPYNPPPPFPASNETCLPYGGRTAPSFEQFQAYGAVLASSQLLTDPDALRVQRETARGLVVLGGAVVAGGAIGSLFAIPAVFNFFFPLTYGGAVVHFTAVAAPAAVVIFAIVVGVIRGISIAEELELPTKLQQAKTAAESNTPGLAQLINTEDGLREVFGEFLVSTLPDFPATSGVPAVQGSDPKFEVSPSGLDTFTATPTLQYKDWDDKQHSVRMNGRWFVDQEGSEPERLTLSIEFLNWEGKKRVASRIGSEFLITDGTDDSAAPIKSAELRYLNWNAVGYVGRIIDSPPTIAAVNVTRPLGGFLVPVQIATVTDADDPPEFLSVAVTSPLSSNGVTLSGLTLAADGTVKASLSTPACPTSANDAAFTLQVTDTRNHSVTATVNVTVPANVPPALTYAPAQSLIAYGSTTVFPTSGPEDPDGSVYNQSTFSYVTVGQPKITPISPAAPPFTGTVTLWRDTSGGIINPAPTGKININNAGPIGAYRVELPVTDGCGVTTVGAFTLNVICSSVNLISVLKDPTCYGASNGQITVNASGYAGNFLYSINNGQSFSATNVFTGLTAGVYDVVVKDADRGCISALQRVSLTQPTALSLTPGALPTAQAGSAFSQSFSASGGTGTKVVGLSGALPNGLSFSPAPNGGTLAGTPLSAGSYPLTLTLTDQNNCTTTQNLTLTVACPTITLAPTSLPNGYAGAAYSTTLAATPTGTYSFSVTSGLLPPGLSLNATTGALTGTPTVSGNYAFAITATGWAGPGGSCTKTQSYNLLITSTCATLTLNPTSLPAGALGTAYSQTVSATGGTAPYTFSLSAGALPSGLTLDAQSGVISGTPTATGFFAFTLRAMGQGGCTGQRSYVLSINCGTLTFTPATLPSGTKNVAYRQQLSVNSAASATFSLLIGSLPPGVTLSSAGVLSGTTLQTGTYNFSVKALAGSCQGTKAYSLVIGSSQAALALSGDYDGDGQSDPALRSASDGVWWIVQSSNEQASNQSWGTKGDVSLLGDYDGDGKSDLAVFRPGDGTFYVKRSSDGGFLVKQWGLATDVPVPGDYDGDGRTDIAVWRGATGTWYIVRSSDGRYEVVAWGAGYAPYHDVPVAGDFDGDGKSDLAVFRRSTGTWLVKRSRDGQYLVKQWGLGTDVPVAADYDGDGQTDIAVWRGADANWYVLRSADGTVQRAAWGTVGQGDVPVPGDYDGDGWADVAVWRASEGRWYVQANRAGAALTSFQGRSGDLPVQSKPQ